MKKVHKELKKIVRSSSSASDKNIIIPSKDVLPSKADIEEEEDEDKEPPDYDYPDIGELTPQPVKRHYSPMPRMSAVPKEQPGQKPVAQVSPSSRKEVGDSTKAFSLMTVEEVVSCLKECSLDNLADRCRKENIDGAFIAEIPQSELKSVFEINELQKLKLSKIIQGWRPRRDSK